MRYRAVIVDDYPAVGEFLVDCLAMHDFESEAFHEAEPALRRLDGRGIVSKFPDLYIVDLRLKRGKMQGLEFIKELIRRDIPAEVLAISGNEPGARLEEAVRAGAGWYMPKPFEDIVSLAQQVKRLAEIGRRRRLRMGRGEGVTLVDRSRLQREVFLSYSNANQELATGLRRHIEARGIGVWYAPNLIEVGDNWVRRIKRGLDEAKIFVGILSEPYLASGSCLGEMGRFVGRMDSGGSGLHLLPVLGTPSVRRSKHPFMQSLTTRFQYIDMSGNYVDGLTALLGRIQKIQIEGSRRIATGARQGHRQP